jgi:hypothetical protein
MRTKSPRSTEFRRTLPKVRRALANTPTYMIFDDHEITDDWYLNPIWRDRVLTSPLGGPTIRNGMVAYALFQGWGNDPVAFETGERKQLLDQAVKLFPQNAVNAPDEAVGGAGGDDRQAARPGSKRRARGREPAGEVALLRAGRKASGAGDGQSHAAQLRLARRAAGQCRGNGALRNDPSRTVARGKGSAVRGHVGTGARAVDVR